jgi:phenylacetate-CoA ligase
MGEVAEKIGIPIKEKTLLRKAIVGAEPWSEQMRIRIKEWLGVDAYDVYGTSELSGPLFCECTEQQGFHVWGDLIYPEILDPDTDEPLPPGQRGELVVTMLQKEGFPIIRYRTGDITTIKDGLCPCGRTHTRLERLSGRVDDMLIIRGINVFPSQIEHTLLGIPDVGEHFMIEVDRKGALDDLLIKVELAHGMFSDKIPDLMRVRSKVERALHSALNVAVTVELAESGSLPRFEGKAKRVIDKRMM